MDLTGPPAQSGALDRAGQVDRNAVAIGSIIINFMEVDGEVTPRVSFAPLGRINPNTIERFLPFIYREIQRAQVSERNRPAADYRGSDRR